MIEIDSVEVLPFSAITDDDVMRSGEPDREALRQRAAHAGPIADDTLVHVETLARIAGMSRSAFSARFTEVVGESAMRYVAQWRLSLAHSHLVHATESLPLVAHRFGYRSEVAFSRAFKRQFGYPPGAARPVGLDRAGGIR